MISYWQYLEQKHPDIPESGNPDEEEEVKQRIAMEKEEIRSNKQEQIENFTKPGNPGLRLKAEFDRLIKVLTLPKIVQDTWKKVKDGESLEDDNIDKIYND